MRTFHIEVENLGPIKSAKFDSSHFNVLCGKNNSGKSICMHTAFCFFSEWRDKIHLQAKSELVTQVLKGSRVSFPVSDYLGIINPAIADAMPAFSRKVKGMLNKTSSSFDHCGVSLVMDEDYLRQSAQLMWANAVLGISPECRMRMKKDYNSERVDVWIENRGAAEFPSVGIITASLNRMLDFVFLERILPQPCLMTAERSGSIMYGDDLRSLSFFNNQKVSDSSVMSTDDDKNHYATPYIRELKNIWSLEQGGVKQQDDVPDVVRVQRAFLKEEFEQYVAGGTFHQEDGRLFFKQEGTDSEYKINEVSTSARALAQLYYFIETVGDGNRLLMIDEPELNLHPARQRSLVRLLARMMRQDGVGIMLTTHSDCIIRELNTLLALGTDSDVLESVMKEYGYANEEILRPVDVACGVVADGTILQVPINNNSGLSIPSFDHTIDKINRVQDAIIMALDAKREQG